MNDTVDSLYNNFMYPEGVKAMGEAVQVDDHHHHRDHWGHCKNFMFALRVHEVVVKLTAFTTTSCTQRATKPSWSMIIIFLMMITIEKIMVLTGQIIAQELAPMMIKIIKKDKDYHDHDNEEYFLPDDRRRACSDDQDS